MSAYSEIATTFSDPGLLMAALVAVGYTGAENHVGNPQVLVSYTGDYRTLDGQGHTTDVSKAMKADIIVRRAEIGGSSNDIGFVRNSSGVFQAIISDYDSSRHGSQWLQRLKFNYAEQNILQTAKKQGLKVLHSGKKLDNGQLEYKFLKA